LIVQLNDTWRNSICQIAVPFVDRRVATDLPAIGHCGCRPRAPARRRKCVDPHGRL